jgi:hypothetical protein
MEMPTKGTSDSARKKAISAAPLSASANLSLIQNHRRPPRSHASGGSPASFLLDAARQVADSLP